MRGAGAGETVGFGLDHGLEGGGAEGALLLQGGADGGQFVVADGFAQELLPPLGAFGGCAAAGQPDGVMGQAVGRAQAEVGLAGGPWVAGGVVDDRRTHGVEFDVAQALQQVVVVGYQAGLVAAFPQRSAAAVAGIEQGHVIAPEALHQRTSCSGQWWGKQQVHMVVHQNPAMQPATGVVQGLGQQVQVGVPVRIVQETGQAVVATLDDVLGNAGQVKTGLSGHAAYRSQPACPQVSAHAGTACRVLGYGTVHEVNLASFAGSPRWRCVRHRALRRNRPWRFGSGPQMQGHRSFPLVGVGGSAFAAVDAVFPVERRGFPVGVCLLAASVQLLFFCI